jgi:cell division protein FtsI (penicillin-binding protein 3)
MARQHARLNAVQAGILLALAALVARAAQVQLLDGRRWAAEAAAQRTEHIALEARRGTLRARDGTPIAVSHETYRVGIAPNELRDPRRDAARLAAALAIPLPEVERALRRRYAYFAGPFGAGAVESIRTLRGVHLDPVLNRFYPSPGFARSVIGRADLDGRAATGLERALDTLLAGRPGSAVVLKDRAGREYASPARVIAEPVPGHDVVLTFDLELQDIAQRALDEALTRLDAEGGDVVILDPVTGEVLALAAGRRDGSARPGALTDTFEPGSVAKIFAAAALLAADRVRADERVSGEGGHYRLPERTIEDEHPLASLTLADAIRVSSNIGLSKFAQRLTPAEQYTMLRAFGFGTPTGIEFPAESPGRLRPPAEWSRLSSASLAMGYEVAVTSLQLAAAYAALANDGLLLEPSFVREVRAANGRVVYRHRPEPVRRVVAPPVARRLREMLVGVVEDGTGSGAALSTFRLAAKTGTSRRVVNGRYAPGQYTASFAAVFPADDPQLVLVVKLETPRRGGYFAATTAAPVTRAVLQQALAARAVALDRTRLSVGEAPAALALPTADAGLVRYVVPWPYEPDTGVTAPRRAVPPVSGRPLRDAVLVLHRHGFRVVVRGFGVVEHTWPAAGDSARAGSTVTLFAGGGRP